MSPDYEETIVANAELEAGLHYAWLEVLLAGGQTELAAIMADGNLHVISGGWDSKVIVEVPAQSLAYIEEDIDLKVVTETSIRYVAYGHFFDPNGGIVQRDSIAVVVRSKLAKVPNDWQQRIRRLVASSKTANQGSISEKIRSERGQQPIVYNEMKFGSQAEVRIAQELERKKVLFFPLPLAVRANTGDRYKDHREVDFLICQDGVWGILEVQHHPDRYEFDKEKDAWFKKSGILCVEHYTAEKCYNKPGDVLDEFLDTLAKHKR